MPYFEQWMAADGVWPVEEPAEKRNTLAGARKSVDCQRVRRFRYSGKRYRVTQSPPVLHTFLFPFPKSLENGGSVCNCVTSRAKCWKPYRFHAGDAFEGFPLRWKQKPASVPNDWAEVRVIPSSEVLASANIARRQRSRDLLALMYESNVGGWTWVEHPDGSWRAHHSETFGGSSENI